MTDLTEKTSAGSVSHLPSETVSRAFGVTATTLPACRDAFLAAREAALSSLPDDGEELES